ncbi:hypothetical protein JKP88DRAFT_238520 [Tribonema minus]|uniref:Uncharacterized protein n=1 Tax=Tribonema minus TaxID=303371 RepID=A0A836CEG8_9STRA|nr:hypothetical protein JKP88DRAFT_238520 [Tribonema minus]
MRAATVVSAVLALAAASVEAFTAAPLSRGAVVNKAQLHLSRRWSAVAPEAGADAGPDTADEVEDEGIIADDNVPGKIVVDDATLAQQQIDLEKYARQLRRQRLDREAEEARLLGWTPAAEINNGRAAMFFIVVGILTEYWTGQSMPQQVETMASVMGLLPLDYESMF